MKIDNRIGFSPTLKFAEAARNRIEKGEKIISMGIGEPDLEVPVFLKNALIKAIDANNSSKYSNSLGNIKLRQAISKDLKARNNFIYEVDQILVTAGAKQALQLILFSLLEDGDEVMFFSPHYVSYIPQILLAANQANFVEINLTPQFRLDKKNFINGLSNRTKVLILNNPNNPCGSVLNKEEYQFILENIIDRDIYVVLDDVYDLLSYQQNNYYSLAQEQALKEKIFYINSFSKSHSIPGWRIGYLCSPKKHIKNIEKIQQHFNTNTSSIIQEACISIYENDFDFINEYRETLLIRSHKVHSVLGPHLKNGIVKPEGGFFYFLNISQTKMNSNDFCAKLIEEEGVALTPGIAFGKDWDNYVRLSFGINDIDLDEGLIKIVQFLKKYSS